MVYVMGDKSKYNSPISFIAFSTKFLSAYISQHVSVILVPKFMPHRLIQIDVVLYKTSLI